MASSEFSPAVCKAVEERASQLWELSKYIWSNPELAYQEVKAHDRMTGFLEEMGFKVQRKYLLDTAFRAEALAPGGKDGPTVCLMAEYDALPGIGHGCGHNLIAEAAMGACSGRHRGYEKVRHRPGQEWPTCLHVQRACMSNEPACPTSLHVQRACMSNEPLVVLGTPAEEGAGGKVLLLEKGAFKDVDAALMAHPGCQDALKVHFNARRQVKVRYEGKAVHASHSPWNGVNAQDAAVAAYINLSLVRQHTNPAAKVLGVVEQFGAQANVISESSNLIYHIRAPDGAQKDSLVARAEKGFQAAAKATGCGIDLELGMEYNEVIHNDALTETYRKHGEALGAVFADANPGVDLRTGGSTDAGNVSYVLPTLHPIFDIGAWVMPHTNAFAEAAGAEAAHRAVLRVAKALALTALDLMSDPALMTRVRSDFAAWKVTHVPSK
ncbi:xaa-Arg dipeptidase [Dermacentor silvarum]|uniref:xaa-Arg dipeptidase n=1 Tax=Dermacentor silvarum TaxID=543639 RepID=UPI00189A64B9|nr:xaa-Arg dipeptidase [Dermacentor silvarum]